MANRGKQVPFHDAIIVAVKEACSREELAGCARVIVLAKVPANHQEIIEALRQKAKEFEAGDLAELKKAICLLRRAAKEKSEKEKQVPERFFPEYLNQGSKGPAVALLQCILRDRGYSFVTVDGEYGEETARGVRALQAGLNIKKDGHFGPATRRALVNNGGLDVNAILAKVFSGKTKAVGP
jgi:hypothetical protein